MCLRRGMYPATSSELARSRFLDYALQRKFLQSNPDLTLPLAKAKAKARLRL